MKQLSQLIAISIFGLNAVQIILAVGTAVILLQLLVSRITGCRKIWEIRRGRRQIENNMWAIE